MSYPTWGDTFECCFKAQSSTLKARTFFLPRFSEKRRLSFELSALKELSTMSPQMGLAVYVTSGVRVAKEITFVTRE